MSDQLKTVDEIMALAKEYARAGITTMPATFEALRAAITDLHRAAARRQESGIMSAEDIRHERSVSP